MCDSFQQVWKTYTLMCVGSADNGISFSSFTYDAFVIALLMLGIALFVTEYLSEEKFKTKRTMVSILLYGCGMLFKGGLYSILALYWLMPKDKFIAGDKRICLKQESLSY